MGVRFTLDEVLGPRRLEALELLAQLHALAPAVYRWWHMPEPRGPRPDVRQQDRARVNDLLARLLKGPPL